MTYQTSGKNYTIRIEQESRSFLLEPQPMIGERIVPSGYLELVRFLHEGAAAPIGLRNVKLTSNEIYGEKPRIGTASFELEPKHMTKAIILLEGGWTLPGPWIDLDLLMLDRNVVIDIENLSLQGGGTLRISR